MSTEVTFVNLVDDKKYSKVAALLQSDDKYQQLADKESSKLLYYQALVLSRQYTKFLKAIVSEDGDPQNLSDEENYLLAYTYFAMKDYSKTLTLIPKFSSLQDLPEKWLTLYAQTKYILNSRDEAMKAYDALHEMKPMIQYGTNKIAAYCCHNSYYNANELPWSADEFKSDLEYTKNLAIAYSIAGCGDYANSFIDEALKITESVNDDLFLRCLKDPDFTIGDASTKFEEHLKKVQLHNSIIQSKKYVDVIQNLDLEFFKDKNEQSTVRYNLALAHFYLKNFVQAKSLVEPLLDDHHNVKPFLLAYELKMVTENEIISSFGEKHPEVILYFAENDITLLNSLNEDLKESPGVIATAKSEMNSSAVTHPAILEKLGDWHLSCRRFDDASRLYRNIVNPQKSVSAKLIICLSHTDSSEAEILADDVSLISDSHEENTASVEDLIKDALMWKPSASTSTAATEKSKMTSQSDKQKKKNLKQRSKQREAFFEKYKEAGEEVPAPKTWVSTKTYKKKRVQRYNQRFAKGSQGMATDGAVVNKSRVRSTAHLGVGGLSSGKSRNKGRVNK